MQLSLPSQRPIPESNEPSPWDTPQQDSSIDSPAHESSDQGVMVPVARPRDLANLQRAIAYNEARPVTVLPPAYERDRPPYLAMTAIAVGGLTATALGIAFMFVNQSPNTMIGSLAQQAIAARPSININVECGWFTDCPDIPSSAFDPNATSAPAAPIAVPPEVTAGAMPISAPSSSPTASVVVDRAYVYSSLDNPQAIAVLLNGQQVEVTGITRQDAFGQSWTEIIFDQQPLWVASQHLQVN